MRIHWNAIDDNSSSFEAVRDFGLGMSLDRAIHFVWDPEVKAIFKQLRKLPAKNARSRARKFLNKNYSWAW